MYKHYGGEGSGLPWEGYYFSAYGIAVKHGFEGTEEEWLLTLRGDRTELRFSAEENELQWKYTEEDEWHTAMNLMQLQTDVEAATLAQAQESAAAAVSAAGHYPYISGETGNWKVWDAEHGVWADTGIHAQGPAGVYVVGAGISAYGKLMLNLSDGRSINCGKVTGEDGVSPTVAVTEIPGGHRVVITDEDGQHSFDVMDGESPDPSSKMDKENPFGTGSFSMNRSPNGAVGSSSVAVGKDTEASGKESFAEGYRTIASGKYSHAEGLESMATGDCSHAEGSGTVAFGVKSHAEGTSTEARGRMSHAEGFFTLATPDYQHVQGKFNVEDSSGQFADIIGWGTNNTSKKNIEATTVEGDKRMKGDVYVGCNDDSTGGTKLATVAELESAIEALRAELGLT